MDRWLERVPGLASGPLWRRGLAAAGYLFAASVAFAALAGSEPSPDPTPVDPEEPQRSIVGTWRGETESPGLGVVFVETIFTGGGAYAQINTSQYPGGTPRRVTGEYTIVAEQNVIQVRNIKVTPDVARVDGILLQYTWLGPNTLRLQDVGCLNYAPELCSPITYTRGN